MIIKELNYHNRTITQNEGDKNKLTNLLNFNYVTVFFPFQVALILLALAAVVSVDSYGKSSKLSDRLRCTTTRVTLRDINN